MGQPARYKITSYRWYADDAVEGSATALAAINTPADLEVFTNYRLRIGVDNYGGDSGSVSAQLQRNLNGAGFGDVTGASTIVKGVTSVHVSDEDATTEVLAQAATFVAGKIATDGVTTGVTLTLTEETEFEFVVSIVSGDVADNDTITFDLTHSAGTAYDMVADNVPTCTVNAPGIGVDVDMTLGTITVSAFNFDIIEGINVDMTLGAISVAALNFDVVEGIDVEMSLGAITVAAFNFDVVEGIEVDMSLGTVTVTAHPWLIEAAAITQVRPDGLIMRPYGSFAGKASGDGVTVEMTLGAITVTAFNFDVVEGINVDLSLGQINVTAFNFNVIEGIDVEMSLGAITVTAFNFDIIEGIDVEMSLGAITVTAYAFDVIEGIEVDMSLAAVTVTAFNFDIVEGIDVEMTLGQVTVTAFNFTIDQAVNVDMTLGQITVTSFNFDVVEGVNVDMTLGTINVTAFNFNIEVGTAGNPWYYYAQQAAIIG